jgi:L-amino acid N-acyltransferase YncA
MPSPVHIRRAQQQDLPGIVTIHNQAIARPYTNAYTEPFAPGDRIKWFEEHSGNCPVYVAVINDEVAGWLSVSPYRSGRAALAHTREVSYYVHESHQKKGIATQLLEYAMNTIDELDAKVYIAVVLDKNAPSIKLLEKIGFSLWGHLPNVAYFDDQPCGHNYYGWLPK